MQFPGSLLAYAVLIPVLAAVTIHIFTKKHKNPPDTPLGWTLLSLLYTCVCVALALMTNIAQWKYLFNEIKFVGYAFTSVFMLLFYLEFLRIKITFFEKTALMAIPALTVFFALTNPMHHLFRKSYNMIYDGGLAYYKSDNSVWMYIYLTYNYILTVVGLFLLLRYMLRRSSVYREQVMLMVSGIVIAFAISISVMIIGVRDYADISVIALSCAGLAGYAGHTLYSPKNMLNMARDLAIKNLDAPFVLFNDLYELADFNHCAAVMIGLREEMLGALMLGDFISDYLHLTDRDIDGREVVLASENLEEVYCRVYARYFTDKGGKPSGCVILLENITKGKRMIKELNFTLHRDRLTGMPNYLAFEQEYEALAKKNFQSIVLIYFNINGMKLINSAFGHGHGDEVVKTVASFIMSACPDRRLCARAANDEFAVLLTDCREAEAIEMAVSVNVRLKNAKHLRLPVSLSYGVTSRMWDAEPLDRLMRRACDDIWKHKLSFTGNGCEPLLDALIAAIDEAGAETAEHIARTRETAAGFGAFLNLEPLTMQALDILAVIHDVGMLATQPSLLHKSDSYTQEELEAVRLHCAKGCKIALASPALAPVAPGVLSHHEWWDGTGYPGGLAGENIPLISRIMAIVDTYDHLAHDFGGGDSSAGAKEKILSGAGHQFDPKLAGIFIQTVVDDSLNK